MKKIFQKTGVNGCVIYVWEVLSPWNELIKSPLFNEEEKNSCLLFKSDKRKTEYLAARLALKTLFNKDTKLEHHSSGQPYIKEKRHLSISHSNNYLAVSLSEEPVGIDIEKPSDKLRHVVQRILSGKENIAFQKNSNLENACRLWSAKEAVFKCIGRREINYRDDIQITDLEEGRAHYLNKPFLIEFEKIDEMILTIASPKST